MSHSHSALLQIVANSVPDGPAPWQSPARMTPVLCDAPRPALPGCKQPLWSDFLHVNISTTASLLVLPKIQALTQALGLTCSGGARAAAQWWWLEGRVGRDRWDVLTFPSAATCIARGFPLIINLFTSSKGLLVGPHHGEAHGGVTSLVRERSPVTGSI